MLKIPTFILGGLLILTGLLGFLLQDPGLSIKLTGPLADDTRFTLSDGNNTVELDLGYPSSEAAGEYAFWMIHLLNQNHAKDRSQAIYAVQEQNAPYEIKSFWHASSKGDTQEALKIHAESGGLSNLQNTDVNNSTVRFVYKNFTGNKSPITLTSSNWTNIKSKTQLNPGDSMQFSKSWTAFIPGILGIILIFLAQAAEMVPNARKHIMHAAVLVGLVGFIAVAKLLPKAISEMNWLKGDPYGIIHASSLKSITMLASAGLLFVFVVLCIVSFVNARKEMAAQAKSESEKKKKVISKVKAENKDATDLKSEKENENKEDKTPNHKNNDGEKKSEDEPKDFEDKKGSSEESNNRQIEEKESSTKKEKSDAENADDKIDSVQALDSESKKVTAKDQEDNLELKAAEEDLTAVNKSQEAQKTKVSIEEKNRKNQM